MKLNPRLTKAIFALLGMSSLYACDDPESPENGMGEMVMYGTPRVEYEIKGTVTDEDNKPIEGAIVSISYGNPEDEASLGLPNDTTDEAGNYNIKYWEPGLIKPLVKCEDINGKYASMEKWADLKEKKKPDDQKDPWLIKMYEAKVDFKLTKK